MKNTSAKFGKKMKELIELVNSTENWEQYVDDDTKEKILSLQELNNISEVVKKHNTTYGCLRAKYMIALRRIREKDNTRLRNGKSNKAQELFNIIENNPHWREKLSKTEISHIELYMKLKNYYKVANELKRQPSNVYKTIYNALRKIK